MNIKKPFSALRVCEYCLIATTLLVAALLIAQCMGIYLEGISPANTSATGAPIRAIYSVEIVHQRFLQILWAIILWIIAWVAVLVARRRGEAAKSAPVLSVETRVALMQPGVEATREMQKEAGKRKAIVFIGVGLCVVCGARLAIYLLTPGHFVSRDMELVMGAFLRAVTPWVVLAFVGLCALAVLYEQSLVKTLEAIKKAPKVSKPIKAQAEPKKSWTTGLRVALYLAAITLVIAGVMNGGMYDVLVKAINICTECIGLG